jgi:hypothetical protein
MDTAEKFVRRTANPLISMTSKYCAELLIETMNPFCHGGLLILLCVWCRTREC